MKQCLEDQLLQNSLPYPPHYDGRSWNTVSSFRRKELPSYLQEGLPVTKYNKIREKFRAMDKFAPPQIKYFEKFIHSKSSPRKKLTTCRAKITQKRHLEDQLNTVKESMQYALVMADRESNVLVNLLEKASRLQEQIKVENVASVPFQRRLVRSKAERRSRLGSRIQKCFSNTVDLVFSLKKKQCVDNQKAKSMLILPYQVVQVNSKSLRLKTYSVDRK